VNLQHFLFSHFSPFLLLSTLLPPSLPLSLPTYRSGSQESATSHTNSNVELNVNKQKGMKDNSSKQETDDDALQNNFSSLDKVVVPPQFFGKTFGLLFRCLYDAEGVIAIALCRLPRRLNPSVDVRKVTPQRVSRVPRQDCSLPSVITAPSMSTVLLQNDEVFILRARLRHV
jgi:hypothetical protein